MSTEIEKLVFEIGKRGLKPEPDITVSQWADRNRFLTSVSSAEAGPWRTSRVPYTQEIMDALSPRSPYERIVWMAGSQIAKTETGLNWVGACIDMAPSPMIYVVPTKEFAAEVSKTRLDPLIENSPVLKNKVKDPRARDSGNTMYLKEFPGGYVNLVGANSPASLSGKPIRYVMLDEVDRFPGNVGGEGDPVYLAITRTRNYPRRKIYMVSSPTIAGHSRIETAFEETDKRFYFVPCSRCGEYQILKFGQIKWDKGSPQAAWYECAHCRQKIFNHEKEYMLPRGEWRPTVKEPKNPLAVGFHLSSLYSPVGWFSWGEIAQMWEDSKRNLDLRRVVVNTVLGETFQERGEAPDWIDLYNRREFNYNVGEVPAKGLILTAGVDCQKDRLEVSIWAWGRGKESFLVDHRVLMGDTSNIKSPCYAALDTLMGEQFTHEHGAMLSIRCLAIDANYNTQTIYNWARRYPVPRVIAVRGSDSMPVMIGQPKAVDVNIEGKQKKRALKLFTLGVSVIKMEFYGWLWLPKPEAGDVVPDGYVHFPDMPEEYFKQLTAEDMKTKTGPSGRVVREWVPLRERNEALDCRVYARAAAAMLNIDRYREEHWQKIEEAIVPSGAIQKPVVTAEPMSDAAVALANVQRRQAPRRRGVISKGVKL